MNTSRRSILATLLSGTAWTFAGAQGVPLKRPMHVHKVNELGLEIWTEARPEWDTRVERIYEQSRFVAETPALTYPPAGMTWVSKPQSLFAESELESAAHGAIHRVAHGYGVPRSSAIELKRAHYGDLTGFEADFSAPRRTIPVDVRIFLGHKAGRAAVVMQASTLQGKLGHIDEHIRRSWANVRYL